MECINNSIKSASNEFTIKLIMIWSGVKGGLHHSYIVTYHTVQTSNE